MKTSLPVNVMLRCKKFARVERCEPTMPGPFKLFGKSNDGDHHVWTRGGHWLEDKTPHRFDIVGVVDAATGAVLPLTDQFARQ